VGVAGGAAADVSVPGAHGPAGGVVGVQGVDAGIVVAHLLQSVQELGGRLGDGGDAGRLKDALVVDDALGVAGGGDAVDLAVLDQVGVVGADGQLVVRGQVAGSGLGAGVR